MRLAVLVVLLFASGHLRAQEPEKDFSTFCYEFFSDSVVQRKSIKFPLKKVVWNQEAEKDDTTFVRAKSWTFSDFGFWANQYNVRLYDSFSKKIRDTDERVVSFEGVENGISVGLYFKRISGKWFLVLWEDSSD